MKILVISNSFPKTKDEIESHYIYGQIESLLKYSDVNIRMFSPTMSIPNFLGVVEVTRKYIRVPDVFEMGKLVIKYPRIHLYNQMYSMWVRHPEYYAKKYYREISDKLHFEIEEFQPDIIYCIGIFLEGYAGLSLKKEYKNIPVAFIEHSVPKLIDACNHPNLNNLYKEILSTLDIYMCVGKTQLAILKDADMYDEKIQLVPNGFMPPKINGDGINALRKTTGYFKILSVGFLEDRKGYPQIIDALLYLIKKKGYSIDYKIIGEGKQRKKYKNLIEKYGLQNNVHMLGRIPHSEVYKYMFDSDLFVLPSCNESFGVVYLESLYCGTPIVLSRGEGISDLLQEGVNCIKVDFGNKNQLVVAIEKCINDSIFLEKLALNGKMVAEQFTWDANAKQIYSIFSNAIHNQS